MLEGHIKFSCVPGFPALRAPPQSCTHLRDTAGRPSEHRGRRASLYNPGGPGGAARAVLPEGPGENTCTQDPEAGSCTPLTARAPPPPPKQKVRGTRRRGKKSTGSGGSRSGAFQGSAHRVSTPPPPPRATALLTSGSGALGSTQDLMSALALQRLSLLPSQPSAGHPSPSMPTPRLLIFLASRSPCPASRLPLYWLQNGQLRGQTGEGNNLGQRSQRAPEQTQAVCAQGMEERR